MGSKVLMLNFMGDVMLRLGRLIDQMFPQHVDEPEESRIAQSFQQRYSELAGYGPSTPWHDTMPLLREADLSFINLETSVTCHATKWPGKVFNYRMHPANIAALQAAKFDYAGLANNHTLDFCEPGLLDTVRALKQAGIAYAGAGETAQEATRPAVLRLQGAERQYEIHVWAASDHPSDWAAVSSFNFVDYTQRCKNRLKALMTHQSSANASLKIFSIHWGPNYSWQPDSNIRELAHWLIDEAGIDIIHGHSSHHVQGLEKYHGKLIIYGCGDFVDDYAVNETFRNDLSGIWRVSVEESSDARGLRLKELRFFPTKIDRFRARRLKPTEPDAEWVRRKVIELSARLGSTIETKEDGSLVLALD